MLGATLRIRPVKGARTQAACEQSVTDEFRTWSQARAVEQAQRHLRDMDLVKRAALVRDYHNKERMGL